MIGYSKKNRENIPKDAFEQRYKEPGLKFNLGLALKGLQTTGPCTNKKMVNLMLPCF